MEKMIKLHIEKLPEGVYLATSDSVQGLIAQGRTIAETIVLKVNWLMIYSSEGRGQRV